MLEYQRSATRHKQKPVLTIDISHEPTEFTAECTMCERDDEPGSDWLLTPSTGREIRLVSWPLRPLYPRGCLTKGKGLELQDLELTSFSLDGKNIFDRNSRNFIQPFDDT
jgi:hypothetical protein